MDTAIRQETPVFHVRPHRRHRAPVLILGLGNDILGDDSVGLHVADRAAALLFDSRQIEVRRSTEMGLFLLDEVADRTAVVVVDAIKTANGTPGLLREVPLMEGARIRTGSPHLLGIRETLDLGRRLGLPMPDQVLIVGIEVEDPYRLGESLSPEIASVVESAAWHVVERARTLANPHRGR